MKISTTLPEAPTLLDEPSRHEMTTMQEKETPKGWR
jgi:hypothetical protein